MKKCFMVRMNSTYVDVTLLLLRLVSGYAMALHGLGKIQSPMGWMPPGSPVPGIFQALAAIAEFGGGIALMLGLVTRLASLGIVFTMLVAVAFHAFMLGDPFVSATGGGSYEMAALYLMINLLFMAIGPGKFSIDRKLFGNCSN